MPLPHRPAVARRALLGLSLLALAAGGCIQRDVAAVPAVVQGGFTTSIVNDTVDKVDLLLEIDNSGSMTQDQGNIAAQLQPLIDTLTHPPDSNGDGTPDYPPVADLHVGVISSDLGSAGQSSISNCNTMDGDDGLFNPLARGVSEAQHPPSANTASASLRSGCGDPSGTPPFLSFDSTSTDAAQFAEQFRCSAILGPGGCGLEQQLESVYRALVTNKADAPAASDDAPNGGFLRKDALLAIVVLSDEEDGSVRDCRYAETGVPCDDATEVFRVDSTRFPGGDMNMRMYTYVPGGDQDPTWPLDRYVDPRDLNRGLLGLKPGHPERILFAAITGVPLQLPMQGGQTDWDALLGAPGANGPDDFVGRDSSTAIDTTTADGPVSMRQANVDPACVANGPQRVVPVCERWAPSAPASEHASPPCSPSSTYYFAVPSRRITEIARRFDQSNLCNGAPCHNGLVASVCGTDYTVAMHDIIQQIQNRLPVPCFPHALRVAEDATTHERTVTCDVRETLPPGISCSDVPGRTAVQGPEGTSTDPDGTVHNVCAVGQVPTGADGTPIGGMEGWYYQTGVPGSACTQQISYTSNGGPPQGASDAIQCIEAVGGSPSATGGP